MELLFGVLLLFAHGGDVFKEGGEFVELVFRVVCFLGVVEGAFEVCERASEVFDVVVEELAEDGGWSPALFDKVSELGAEFADVGGVFRRGEVVAEVFGYGVQSFFVALDGVLGAFGNVGVFEFGAFKFDDCFFDGGDVLWECVADAFVCVLDACLVFRALLVEPCGYFGEGEAFVEQVA